MKCFYVKKIKVHPTFILSILEWFNFPLDVQKILCQFCLELINFLWAKHLFSPPQSCLCPVDSLQQLRLSFLFISLLISHIQYSVLFLQRPVKSCTKPRAELLITSFFPFFFCHKDSHPPFYGFPPTNRHFWSPNKYSLEWIFWYAARIEMVSILVYFVDSVQEGARRKLSEVSNTPNRRLWRVVGVFATRRVEKVNKRWRWIKKKAEPETTKA